MLKTNCAIRPPKKQKDALSIEYYSLLRNLPTPRFITQSESFSLRDVLQVVAFTEAS
jgi:hypothetical protein